MPGGVIDKTDKRTPPGNTTLPPKENALFKRIVKCYERKQYKNGLKFAKQILSNPRFNEHGETLAMKGLTLNCLGRKEEAYDHVRRGLRNDLKSHVCWHVYGLLQRSYKKYDEAIKCYRNALKCEKDNMQILRDLSLLQIQMRDLEGYRDTRYHLLMLRPQQRASWICYAMSYHILADYKNALNILETFMEDQQVGSFDYEHSELLVYQNLVIQESGDLFGALKHLEHVQDQILDKLTLKENLGELHLKLAHFDSAVKYYEQLIDRNPENTTYYEQLIRAHKLQSNADIVDFYAALAQRYQRAMPPRRLPLNYAQGAQFRALVDQYMRRALSKGVPPLFLDLRSLYVQETHVHTIEELMVQYVDALKTSSRYDTCDTGPKEPASALLWVYYYLAQHYDYLNQTAKALFYVDAAIDHTPTLIELFVTKGRIYKHAGDPEEACRWMDEAQSLDTADRYINSKCAKYMLRANHVAEAESICAKFTREGVSAMENLNEMQCMWFQIECALAYQRLGKYGDALKKCHETDRHFSEIIEDQFDFHTYCMRKTTLRSYVGLLRFEDVLRGHPFYFKAAKCAIEVYLHLFDEPLREENGEQELNTENLAPSELKKLRNKQRKARRKAEQWHAQAKEAQVKREQYQKSRQQADNEADVQQLDELIPDKLARCVEPLEQAIKFLQPLQALAKDNIETHLMAFELYYRKGKVLLMMQSLKRAHKLSPNNSQLHSCLIRFWQVVTNATNKWNPAVERVVQQQMAIFFDKMDAHQFNTAYLEAHLHSLQVALECAKIMYSLDVSSQQKAINLVTNLATKKYTDVNLQNCVRVLKALQSGAFGECTSDIETFIEECHEKLPYAAAFATAKYTNNNNNNNCSTSNNNNKTSKTDDNNCSSSNSDNVNDASSRQKTMPAKESGAVED